MQSYHSRFHSVAVSTQSREQKILAAVNSISVFPKNIGLIKFNVFFLFVFFSLLLFKIQSQDRIECFEIKILNAFIIFSFYLLIEFKIMLLKNYHFKQHYTHYIKQCGNNGKKKKLYLAEIMNPTLVSACCCQVREVWVLKE